MTREELVAKIISKHSFLCIGLDSDPSKLPRHLKGTKDAILQFNEAIIHSTAPYAVAFKINTAFYEAMGAAGWEVLSDTLDLIPPEFFVIADAKRGDIGNTSGFYAKAFFETLEFDAITVAPYMGEDSVAPFLAYHGKWVILLALTSNQGSQDFQMIRDQDGVPFYQRVLQKSAAWAGPDQLMYVVGATHPDEISAVRKVVPNHFLLIPGVGTQGGDLKTVAKRAMNQDIGILVNTSRSVIFASGEEDFAEKAANEAKRLQQQMQSILKEAGLVKTI
jgi:orotidine-5'-phosphate decarboxylase